MMREALEARGYEVHEAETGQLGIEQAAKQRPGVVVLGLGLPDLDGIEVLRTLRESSIVPVLVLTVKEGDAEKVRALDAGADDYVAKPFGVTEFVARFRATQSRARRRDESEVFKRGDLTVDLAARRVTRGGVELKLTTTEFALMRTFVRHAGRVLTHRQLFREVRGPHAEEHRQYLAVSITHLRSMIERDPKHPELIRTESGIGYRFAAAE